MGRYDPSLITLGVKKIGISVHPSKSIGKMDGWTSPLRAVIINTRRRHHTFEAKLRNASTLLRLGRTSKLALLSP